MVQFTSSTRVPVPKLPSGQLNILSDGQDPRAISTSKRIASQTARVFNASEIRRQESFELGMHYVNTYGESMLDPGKQGGKENTMMKVQVKIGERFTFRVHITTKNGEYHKLEARLTSGQPLPGFLRLDLTGYGVARKAVEFHGVPGLGDIGELNVGVYEVDSGECLAKVVVQVV